VAHQDAADVTVIGVAKNVTRSIAYIEKSGIVIEPKLKGELASFLLINMMEEANTRSTVHFNFGKVQPLGGLLMGGNGNQ